MVKILIVEDERPIADLLDMSLTSAGYVCECLDNGKDAADAVEQKRYDLVLLDVMLPGISGFELMEYFAPLDIPVIFITARSTVKDRIVIGDVWVDLQSRRAYKNDEPVNLTAKEYSLLTLFLQNRNIALFRETIYERVWESDYMGDSRTVDLHVQRLRKKLDWQDKIVAVYKVGYRLEDRGE